MRFIVTGGVGFIGSHLVDSLLAENHEIVVIDNFDPFYDITIKLQNIKSHRQYSKYQLIEADIRNREQMMSIFKEYKPETIIHLAAKAGVRPSLLKPDEYVNVNINGTVNLLDASVMNKVNKFIFASSSSVYGLNEKIPFSEDDPIVKQASPYGATKAAGEALCRSYNNCYSLPIVALRFFTVYGPRQRPDLAIHKFAAKIANNEIISLFGDGSTCRDYTYVDDIVQGIKAAINYCNKGYDVFNLGNDRPIKLIELVKYLELAMGNKALLQWMPEQIGDVPQTWANIEKSRRLLKYEPNIDIITGLHIFAKWIMQEV